MTEVLKEGGEEARGRGDTRGG